MKVTIEGTPEEIAEGLERLRLSGPTSVNVVNHPGGHAGVCLDSEASFENAARTLQRIARDYKAKNGKGLFE